MRKCTDNADKEKEVKIINNKKYLCDGYSCKPYNDFKDIDKIKSKKNIMIKIDK